jgi:hypothetical protein
MEQQNQKKKSIMKDKIKVKECDNLFRSYLDCVVNNSSNSTKESCYFFESSLQTQCFLPKKWFEPTNDTK